MSPTTKHIPGQLTIIVIISRGLKPHLVIDVIPPLAEDSHLKLKDN